MNIVGIILARGGSVGIPKKNIKLFCGKPLISWTIEQALRVPAIHSLWVSSDDEEILAISKAYNINIVKRPDSISGSDATSESGWMHALEVIEKEGVTVDSIIGLQVTSPLRESEDISNAVEQFKREELDSLFSGALIEDFYIWKKDLAGDLKSINYDYERRQRRQQIEMQYVENGSFYIFKKEVLLKYKNRLGGKIGIALMDFWKSFELDTLENWTLCEIMMREYLLK